ncbi:calcium/proton exchanger [Barrientosiimonas marina]
MNRALTILSIIGVPVSVAGVIFQWPAVMMFIIYCLTIIALASVIGRGTDSLAIVMGPRIGGLLNATFGNAVELIISFFSLKAGLINIVLASFTGSILGNLLLVAGLSFFVGGLKYKRQSFAVQQARHNAGLLIFAVIVAFVMPVVFTETMNKQDTMVMSAGISIILILLYMAAMLFKFVTHRGVYQGKDNAEESKKEEETPEWGKVKAMIILATATIAVAYVSDHLVDTFEVVGAKFGLSELFIGVMIVGIIGNAAEHVSAVYMAYKNKMEAVMEIAVGSTLQVAMFVLPVLVLLSLLFSPRMPLTFTMPELVGMVTAVLLINMLSTDGDSNWFDGAVLLGAYIIMGIGFYFV